MDRVKINLMAYFIFAVLSVFLVLHLYNDSEQVISESVVGTEFIGEYSIDGGEWLEYSHDLKLPSYEGDIVFRGKLNKLTNDQLLFYMDHIGVKIDVDGEEVYVNEVYPGHYRAEMCGAYWGNVDFGDVDSDSIITITLHNVHEYGNANAFNTFMNSLCVGTEKGLDFLLTNYHVIYKVMGIITLVFAILIIGMAVGYFVQRVSYYSELWSIGLMVLFMGVYIYMEIIELNLNYNLVVFNTTIRLLALMFTTGELLSFIRKILTGKRKMIATAATIFLVSNSYALLFFAITDQLTICQVEGRWAMIQLIISVIFLFISALELRKKNKKTNLVWISVTALLIASILELFNARLNFWTSGLFNKNVFSIILIAHVVKAARGLISNHEDSARYKALANELKNNRIVLAMSQIRTHFIFNVLTAISGMLEYDPKLADETLITFSRYLRANIDVMEQDGLEPFEKSLAHLNDYVALEQIRFGDKLKYITNIEYDDFLIPPLALQPIIENSIKHGVLNKIEGGTIVLSSKLEGDNIVIRIIDDGIGFDVNAPRSDKSVGMKNVRFRLESMVKGSIKVNSSKGNGCETIITIPYKEAHK